MLVPLQDALSAPRPRAYLLKNGQLVVRPREGEIDEGIADFLKKVAKQVASKASKTIRRLVGKKEPPPKPVAKPTPVSKQVAKPTPSHKTTTSDLAAAKARAAKRVKIAASAEVKKRQDKKTTQGKRAVTIAKKRKETMRQALAANRAERQKRKAASQKPAEKLSVAPQSARKSKADGVNAQLAHCVLAVRYKRKKSARAAWNICRANLTKHGYLKGPYREDGKVADLKATQKGSRRAMQHAMEKHPLGGGIKGIPAEKWRKFKVVFRPLEPTV